MKRTIALIALLLSITSMVNVALTNTSNAEESRPTALVRASGPSPFASCSIQLIPNEREYLNAEVEPWLAVNPQDSDNLVGVWQQDRFEDGGSRGLLTGVSRDGGQSWSRTFPHFSRCAGGNAQNGGDYERASDPWVSFSPGSTAYQIALSFDFFDAPQAILVSRSKDGGGTWSEPITLIRDTDPKVVDDKESITADPVHHGFVYAVWDRLDFNSLTNLTQGPTWFSRTTNGGALWEPARNIYDPGLDASTIANQIAVLPNGDLVDLFVRFTNESKPPTVNDAVVGVIRSQDKGATWSQPIIVSTLKSIGVVDPKTQEFLRTGDVIPNIAVDRETGTLYVVWQDARFSNGLRDGIVLSKSTDGGLTWSAPVQVNQAPQVQAFTAAVDVASNGAIGVTYYDFRKDTNDPSVLLTNYWQITSRDGGATWKEIPLAGPYDMRTAPITRGFFVGDYQGLNHAGERFIPFFVKTNSGQVANRTDVFAAVPGEEDDEERSRREVANDRVEVNAIPLSLRQRVEAHRRRPHDYLMR
jgi:hypothetical protein